MIELKCPHCGQAFQADATEYDSIALQIRNAEFEREVAQRVKASMDAADATARAEVQMAVVKAERGWNEKQTILQGQIAQFQSEVMQLRGQLQLAEHQGQHNTMVAVQAQKEKDACELREAQTELAYYKDLKTRMSTKMVGESLEQYCRVQFDQIRAMAFPNAYFEKDNDARTGSKGDFIYREQVNGVDLLSIMFEMKNEMDVTATKHRNEDFFKELDRDRREKGCEYAVLVSMLEADSELYNGGIVDVSHRYPKMYVVRPQFFIPLISVLRNASLNALEARAELLRMQSMNLDVTTFESNLLRFKDGVSRNYDLASRQFDAALDEIDKSIEHMQKVKAALMSSQRNLRLLNDKTEDLTIRRLTVDAPQVREMFAAAGATS